MLKTHSEEKMVVLIKVETTAYPYAEEWLDPCLTLYRNINSRVIKDQSESLIKRKLRGKYIWTVNV